MSGAPAFSLYGYYDDDHEFFVDLAKTLDVKADKAFHNKLTKVVRELVHAGIFWGQMQSTQKYYIGEPTHQKNYMWCNLGKRDLIANGERPGITMTPQGEAEFLLRRVYPYPDN